MKSAGFFLALTGHQPGIAFGPPSNLERDRGPPRSLGADYKERPNRQRFPASACERQSLCTLQVCQTSVDRLIDGV